MIVTGDEKSVRNDDPKSQESILVNRKEPLELTTKHNFSVTPPQKKQRYLMDFETHYLLGIVKSR